METRSIYFPKCAKDFAKCVVRKNCSTNHQELKSVILEVSDTTQVIWASDTRQIQMIKYNVKRSSTSTEFTPANMNSDIIDDNVRRYEINPKDFAKLCDGRICSLYDDDKDDKFANIDRLVKIGKEGCMKFMSYYMVLSTCKNYLKMREYGGCAPYYDLTETQAKQLINEIKRIKKAQKVYFEERWFVAFLPDAEDFVLFDESDSDNNNKLFSIWNDTKNCRPVIIKADMFLKMSNLAGKSGLRITPVPDNNTMFNLDWDRNEVLSLGVTTPQTNTPEVKLRELCSGAITKELLSQTLDGIRLYEWSDGLITIKAHKAIADIIKSDMIDMGGIWVNKRDGWLFPADKKHQLQDRYGDNYDELL